MAQFHIPKPCTEDWDKMTPEEQGRHCKKCAKTVYDVKDWSDQKVLKTYEQNNNSLCIRVPAERVSIQPLHPNRTWRYYLIALLASFWLIVKKSVGRALPEEEPDDVSTSKDTFYQMNITGTVKDSLEGIPVQGVAIVLKQGTVQLGYSITNDSGRFELKVRDHKFIEGDTLSLKISHISYGEITKDFAARDTVETDVFLKESHICLNETVVLGNRRFSGIMVGVIRWDGHEIISTRPLLDEYDTKTIHHDELERLNLRN